MKKEDIYNAITDIDPCLIEEADRFRFKKQRKLLPVILSVAAVFVLVFAVNSLYDMGILTGIPENSETLPDTTGGLLSVTEGTEQTSAPEAVIPSTSQPQTDFEITTSPSQETTDASEVTTQQIPETNTDGENDQTVNIHINDGSKEVKPQTVMKASYPEMSPYPLLGELDPRYNKWAEDTRKLWRIEVETDNISEFSRRLMSEALTAKDDENNIVSPLNIYMALGMLAEAADGNSRQQLLDLLGSPSIDALREQANKIWQKNYRDDGVMKSIMSNSLWLNDTILYKKSAVTTIAQKYFASVYSGTMGSEKYNKMLNNWIKDNTGGLLSPDISTDYDTVMAIASTLLYQTKWNDEFETSETEKGTFYASDGDRNISYMKASRYMHYYWGENFSAISLGLDIGGRMWFILPDESVDADTIFSDNEMLGLITAPSSELSGKYEKSKYLEVHMAIPKFDVKSEQNVLESIKKLGVTDILDGELSDFSVLATNSDGIFISEMSHGVRVKIDEEGVCAAAYSVIIGAGSAAPPDEEVYFTLDRPFAFVISLDNATPLFAGVVNNP